MKTLGEIVNELSHTKTAYKFSVTATGRVRLSVDGLMASLERLASHA